MRPEKSVGAGAALAGADAAEAMTRRRIHLAGLVATAAAALAIASPAGGNVVRNNCIKGAADPYYATQNGSGILSPQVGFTASSNLIVDPGYENAMSGDYRIPSDSPCAAILAQAKADPSMGQVDRNRANSPVQPASSTRSTVNGTPTSANRTGNVRTVKKRGKKSAKKKAHAAEAKARA